MNIPETWERRDVYRNIRREILAQSPQSDLRTFLTAVLEPIRRYTESKAAGAVMRFRATTRDLAVLVDDQGRSFLQVQPIDEILRGEEFVSLGERIGFGQRALQRCAKELDLENKNVLSIPINTSTGKVAILELAEPNPSIVPDGATFLSDLPEIRTIFELAFLHARIRRERLESSLLHKVGEELGRAVDLPSLLDSILSLLRQVVTYDAAAIFVLNDEGLDTQHHAIRGYAETEEPALHLKLGEGVVGWVANTGEPQIVPRVSNDPRYVSARSQTQSEMVAPLKSGGKLLGVFVLESDHADHYTAHDMDLLMTFAGQAAVALERASLLDEQKEKQRLEQEVDIARRIQRSFLPRLSKNVRRRGIAGTTLSSLEVSGDYYDVVEHEDGSIILAVADVSGKGIPAAMIMSSLRAAFRMAAKRTKDPKEWCRELNDLLVTSLRDTEFVTGIFGWLSPDQKTFTYCNAGHNFPGRFRKGSEPFWLQTGGLILGAVPDRTYEQETIDLKRGDRLVLYTDGVTEAFDKDREEFGEEGLVATVTGNLEKSALEIRKAVLQDVKSFVDGPFPDDLTLMVVEGPA